MISLILDKPTHSPFSFDFLSFRYLSNITQIPLIICEQLYIHYIRSYLCYLNLRTLHFNLYIYIYPLMYRYILQERIQSRCDRNEPKKQQSIYSICIIQFIRILMMVVSPQTFSSYLDITLYLLWITAVPQTYLPNFTLHAFPLIPQLASHILKIRSFNSNWFVCFIVIHSLNVTRGRNCIN